MLDNLLKNKPTAEIYNKGFSEQEVYEADGNFLLRIVDFTGALEKVVKNDSKLSTVDELIDIIFESARNYSLSRVLDHYFLKDLYNVQMKLYCESSHCTKVKVVITKRSAWEKIKEKALLILNKFDF